MKGFDCATPLTEDKARQMRQSGMEFVVRYLTIPKYSWKRLTRAEAEAITAGGLWIGSVWETTADRASGGAAAGHEDGPAILAEAQAIGMPKGATIYLAVDFDITSADHFAAVGRYFRAAKEHLGDYVVKGYGEKDLVDYLHNEGICDGGWQTYAWSRGQKSQYMTLYQYQNGAILCGLNVDYDQSFGHEGFWNTQGLKPEPLFTDVDASRWSAPAIAKMVETKIMNGYGDGTFRPGQPVTREELASVVAETINYVMGVK